MTYKCVYKVCIVNDSNSIYKNIIFVNDTHASCNIHQNKV